MQSLFKKGETRIYGTAGVCVRFLSRLKSRVSSHTIMKLLIDGDSCRHLKTAIKFARKKNIEAHVFCDYNHQIHSGYATVHIVDQHPNSADEAILNCCHRNDILITNDVGLAALALVLGACVINNHGFQFTNRNINTMLNHRYMHQRARRKSKRRNIRPDAINIKNETESFANVLNHVFSESRWLETKQQKQHKEELTRTEVNNIE